MIVENGSVILGGKVCVKTARGGRITDDICLLGDRCFLNMSSHKLSSNIRRYGCK
ncbi:hypothetical protein C2G38_2077227 [Gigaspora rosea]|uniref:Uncharacterized protein n=1 Tax=Gigaspora rosea TaxID=44941 RepID=A0A397VPI1_9GLOM|nr:hypothetical protein C2G38_2077227 [Gigaspora rosea]